MTPAAQLIRLLLWLQVNASRNALLYVKDLQAHNDPTSEGGVVASSLGPPAGIGAPMLASNILGMPSRNQIINVD